MAYNIEDHLEGVSEKYRSKVRAVLENLRCMGLYRIPNIFCVEGELTSIRFQRFFELIEYFNIDISMNKEEVNEAHEAWEQEGIPYDEYYEEYGEHITYRDLVVEGIEDSDTICRLFGDWGCSDLPEFIGKLEELSVAAWHQFEYECPYPDLKVKFTFRSDLLEVLMPGINAR